MAIHRFVPRGRSEGSVAALLILLLGLLSLLLAPGYQEPWLAPWIRIAVVGLGASLLAIIVRAWWIGTALAIVTLLASGAGLAEYFERTAWPATEITDALLGVTALATMAGGAAALILVWWTSARKRSVAVLSIAAAIFVLTMFALFLDVRGGADQPPADPVVIVGRMLLLVTIASGLVALSGRRAAHGEVGRRWLVVPVVLGVTAAAVVLSFQLRTQEIAAVDAATEATLERVVDHARAVVETSVVGIERMAARAHWYGQPDEARWMADASLFTSHHEEVVALAWSGPDLELRWLAPAGARDWLAYDAIIEQLPSVQSPPEVVQVVARGPATLRSGEPGMLIHVPLFSDTAVTGFITGFYRLQPLLDGVVDATAPGYRVDLVAAGDTLYRRADADGSPTVAGLRAASGLLAIHGLEWELRILPGPGILGVQLTWLPGITLAFGLVLAVLLGMAVHQAETNRIALRRLTGAVRQRSRTENELRRHRRELEDRVAARTTDLARKQEELEATNARLERLATTDELTGLWNRRHFFATVERAFDTARRYQRPLAIALFDLDDFKQINDEYGHRVGDAVLVRVGEVCRQELRDVDLAARYGGEEFVVLFPETDLAGACLAAERLRAALAATAVEVSGQVYRCTVSIGLAERGDADTDIDPVLQRADEALYAAKAAGRNCVRPAVATVERGG
jgi:diguanylate cyclase (GGDEF)-like protein